MPDGVPAQADAISDTIRVALQLERDKLAADRERIALDRADLAEEKLRYQGMEREAQERVRPPWWAEWIKPAPILAFCAAAFGAFQVYQSDKASIQSRFQEQSAALLSVANEVHANLDSATSRSSKYIPEIEADHAAVEAQKLINDQNNDRMQNVATAIGDLRRSIEALRDAVTKTHEELMIEEAKRERESRNIPTPRASDAGQGR